MEEEKGRWARVKARAGERLARAEAVRWRNIVLEEMGWMTRAFGAGKREFGGLRLGEFEAALARALVIGWLKCPIEPQIMMSQLT
jgi:hypothetical protein